MQKNIIMTEQEFDPIPQVKEHFVEVRMAYTIANSDIDVKQKSRKRRNPANLNELMPNKRHRCHYSQMNYFPN